MHQNTCKKLFIEWAGIKYSELPLIHHVQDVKQAWSQDKYRNRLDVSHLKLILNRFFSLFWLKYRITYCSLKLVMGRRVGTNFFVLILSWVIIDTFAQPTGDAEILIDVCQPQYTFVVDNTKNSVLCSTSLFFKILQQVDWYWYTDFYHQFSVQVWQTIPKSYARPYDALIGGILL